MSNCFLQFAVRNVADCSGDPLVRCSRLEAFRRDTRYARRSAAYRLSLCSTLLAVRTSRTLLTCHLSKVDDI